MNYLVVLSTFDKREEAERISRLLLQKRLCACIQIIGPIKSLYLWKGKAEEAEEWLCLMKTSSQLYKEVEALLLKEHPYEVPEIIALPISIGSPFYMKWLEEELAKEG
jgi:periplasmic divalent cation tolerance protein